MFPGACWFFHILVWAPARVEPPVADDLVRGGRLLAMGEMGALDALLPHPDEPGIEGQVETCRPGAEYHHASALGDEAGGRKGRFPGMFEDDVNVLLAGDVPDRLPELAGLRHVGVKFRRVHLGQLAPAVEILAVDHALGAQAQHIVALRFIRDDADGVGARCRAQLHAEDAETARCTPDEHVVAGPDRVRRMAEQHPVGRRQRQRVACRLLPREVLRLPHELARLHPAELSEGAVRRLVTPDALGLRKHRVAAIALLVVPVVLVAVDDHLVSHLPAPHLGSHCPHDARGVGSGHVEGLLVAVERRDGLAQRSPNAVVVDAGGHHEDQHLVVADAPGRHSLELHRALRRAVSLLADGPGPHPRRHMAERRDLANLVKVLGRGLRQSCLCGHGRSSVWASARIIESMLQCAIVQWVRSPPMRDSI